MKKQTIREIERLAATLPQIDSGIINKVYKGRAGKTELGRALSHYENQEVPVNHYRRMKNAFTRGGWPAVQAYVNKYTGGRVNTPAQQESGL